MNKTSKKFKKLEKKITKMLPWRLTDYQFLGDMHHGSMLIVITAKEK